MQHKPRTVSARLRILARKKPALIAAIAYAVLSLAGGLLLASQITLEASRTQPVTFIDALFVATSAVSTTGLVPLDPGTTFNFAGELIILVLLQVGGLGYMTLMSYAFLLANSHLSPVQRELTRTGLSLTPLFDVPNFVRRVVIFTAIIEGAGAVALSSMFAAAGVENPIWNGIFHSISSFCTAGFSLFPTSLEGFNDHAGILIVVSLLSYAGAMGFVVISETIDRIMGRRTTVSATTRLIVSVTAGLLVFGTIFLSIFEPLIAALPGDQRIMTAFFQTMTASTTVGFNSVPIGALAPATIVVLYLMMFVGASPSGTGGGLKTTTVAVLVATAIASLTGRKTISAGGTTIDPLRVQQATSTLVVGLFVVFCALVALDTTGSYPFDKAVFEVFSALGTVGLSMGLTGELNDAGKLIISAVMYIGRVGILTFFVAFAFAAHNATQPDHPRQDVML